MRAKELRQRKLDDLRTMARTLRDELFGFRLQNAATRLDRTSQIGKTRRDLARVLTLVREHELGLQAGAASAASAEAPAPAAPQSAESAKPAKTTRTAKTAKTTKTAKQTTKAKAAVKAGAGAKTSRRPSEEQR